MGRILKVFCPDPPQPTHISMHPYSSSDSSSEDPPEEEVLPPPPSPQQSSDEAPKRKRSPSPSPTPIKRAKAQPTISIQHGHDLAVQPDEIVKSHFVCSECSGSARNGFKPRGRSRAVYCNQCAERICGYKSKNKKLREVWNEYCCKYH